MNLSRLFISCLSLCLTGTAPASAEETVPVMVGGEATLDACGTLGAVTGLDPQGDNTLTVRNGPGTRYAAIDFLPPDRKVWICDQTGEWFAVVYAADGQTECNVSSPQAERAVYDGPCSAGWVSGRYVTILAG